MSWVVLGIIGGGAIRLINISLDFSGNRDSALGTLVLATMLYGVAAIGGMVVVGQMIRDYGICTLLT